MTPAPCRPAAAFLSLVLLAGCATAAPRVTVDGRTFAVEVSATPQQRVQGLSGRPQVPAGTGMLFTYPDSGIRSYWMSGMLVSIDLAWLDGDRVVAVQTLPPCPAQQPCPSYVSPVPVDAVLEVAAGALAGVEPGAVVVIEH